MTAGSRSYFRWYKSSHSAGSACLEVQRSPHGVRVRDSFDPAGPELEFDAAGWNEFLDWASSVESHQ